MGTCHPGYILKWARAAVNIKQIGFFLKYANPIYANSLIMEEIGGSCHQPLVEYNLRSADSNI